MYLRRQDQNRCSTNFHFVHILHHIATLDASTTLALGLLGPSSYPAVRVITTISVTAGHHVHLQVPSTTFTCTQTSVYISTCSCTLVYLYLVQHVQHVHPIYLYIVQHVQSPCSALNSYCVYHFLGCGHQIHPHLGRAVISLT